MKHVLIERATPEELAAAKEAADWLVDAVATAMQDRRFLRGDNGSDVPACEAIEMNGVIACLRAIKALKP